MNITTILMEKPMKECGIFYKQFKILKKIYFIVKKFTKLILHELEYILINSRLNHSLKKKLIIVQFDVIGDYIIFTDILKYFRTFYSKQEWDIILIGDSSWENLIELKVNCKDSWVDEFIPINSRDLQFKNYSKRYKILSYLNKLSGDTVLNPNMARTENMDLIVRYTSAKNKIIQKSNQ